MSHGAAGPLPQSATIMAEDKAAKGRARAPIA